MARKKIHDALDRLAGEEQKFLDAEFLAPVLVGGRVSVRIAGVVCEMQVMPRDFRGFGVFKPISHGEAKLVRAATMSERRKYLELFPRVLLVISSRSEKATLAVPTNAADSRFSVQGQIDVRLIAEAELFDTIVARFDGSQFWFDQLDPRADPAAAPYLRQALANATEPRQLDRPGLTPGQRIAYMLNYAARLEAILQDERTRNESRLREALEHAGAELRDFVEHHDEYRVTYEVDGRRHTSLVRKDNLTVQTAGICLSGQDRNFDLASLVGVMRQSREVFG
jgi:hypothetical protein